MKREEFEHAIRAAAAVLDVREVLVRFESPGTNGVIAWCLEPHDLWVSKAVAGRPKDLEFCGALLDRALVAPERLRERLAAVGGLDARVRDAVAARIAAP